MLCVDYTMMTVKITPKTPASLLFPVKNGISYIQQCNSQSELYEICTLIFDDLITHLPVCCISAPYFLSFSKHFLPYYCQEIMCVTTPVKLAFDFVLIILAPSYWQSWKGSSSYLLCML